MATGGGQYDIMTVGAYEVPIWGENDWLVDVTDRAGNDPSYDLDDLFEPVRKGVSFEDRVYALPFYGESSFLMYRKDLFAEAGIQMPERPTWEQVASYAKQLKTDRAGICLRGKPGWGDLFASLTTVVNTFGGQWYDMNWDAQLTSPEFKRSPSTSTPWPSPGRPTRRPSASPSASTCSAPTGRRCGDATSAAGSVESSGSRARSATSGRRSRRPRTPAGCGPGTWASAPRATRRTRPGSSSGGPPPRST